MSTNHLDVKFWSLYLDHDMAEKLVFRYQQTLLRYYSSVSPTIAWIMALEQVKNPSMSIDESEIEVLKQHVSEDMTCLDLKDMVCQQLPHTVIRVKECHISMGNQMLVAETEEISIRSLCFDDWELLFMAKHPEISCSSTALKSLQIYCPIRYNTGSMYVLTLLTKYDSEAGLVTVRGRIYVRNLKCRRNPLLDRHICQTLHALLVDLRASELPQIPLMIEEKNNNELTTIPGMAISFPLKCSYEFFRDRDYRKNYLTYFPALHQKLHSYMSFSSEKKLSEFIRTREMINVGDWLCHRVMPFDNTIICPYSPEINEIDEKYSVRGGLIYGDAMVGKTHHMLQHVFSTTTNESKQTVFILQPYDRKIVKTAVQMYDKDKLSGVFWDSTDFGKIDEKKFYAHKVIIVNAKFIARSTSMRNFLLKFPIHRLVIDQFDQIDMKSKLAHFLKTVNTDIVWLITSRLYVDLLPILYELFRLNKYFVYSNLQKDYSLMAYAIFRQLSYHIIYGKNQLALPAARITVTYARIELPRRYGDQYPLDQITVSIRETLKKGTTKQMQGLLSLLSALDAGVAIKKREVDDMLLFYGFNVRVGGGIYVSLPPLVDIPLITETVDSCEMCPICQQSIYEPIRNMGCHHIFCYVCLNEWNRLKSSCPCCRTEFKPEFFRMTERTEDDVITILGKRREREEAKINDYVLADELYFDNLRSHSLQNVLQQELYEKVLVITHWRQNLQMYLEAVKAVVPVGTTIHVVSKKMNYTECGATDKLVDSARVLITHADNVNYFRNDNRFRQVIFMDNDASTESLENWYNYFRHTVSRIYHLTEGSLDKMFMLQLDGIVRNNPVNNVTFPKMNSREILTRYQMYLRRT